MRLIRSLKPVKMQTVDEPSTACKKVASLDELIRSGLRFSKILTIPLSATASYEQKILRRES